MPKSQSSHHSAHDCLFQWQNKISGLGSLQRDQNQLSFSQQLPAPVTPFAPCSLSLCSALKPRKENLPDFINNVGGKNSRTKAESSHDASHPWLAQSFLQDVISLHTKTLCVHLPSTEICLCKPALGRKPLFRTDSGWAGTSTPLHRACKILDYRYKAIGNYTPTVTKPKHHVADT